MNLKYDKLMDDLENKYYDKKHELKMRELN